MHGLHLQQRKVAFRSAMREQPWRSRGRNPSLQHRVKPAARSWFHAAAALGASSPRLSGRRLCGMHFVLQQQLHLHLSFDTFAATTAA